MSYSIKKKHKIIHFTDSSEINIDLKTTDVCSISSYENAEGIVSLPRYIEEKSDHLKQRYLNFIKQLSETNVGGKTLEKHLKIDEGFSLWWMSPINEKNIYKQPITSIIKALAIEEFLLDGHYEKVILSISDYRLSLVISDLCSNLGVQSEYFSISKIYASENKEKPEDISRIKNLLKNNYFVSMIKGLVYLLRVLIQQTKFKKTNKDDFKDDALIFVAPLAYLRNVKKEGRVSFNSELWSGLPDLILEKGLSANWLHLFSIAGEIKEPEQASSLIRDFNLDKKFFHYLIETEYSVKLFFKVFYQWLYYSFTYFRLGSIKSLFKPNNSKINLWPFFKGNFYSSFSGSQLIYNLFTFHYLNQLFASIPTQEKCFYLYENHAWEKALTYCWRKYNKGKIIAVIHSTVRYWDLRHFHHIKDFSQQQDQTTLLPDFFVLNGQVAKDEYIKAGVPDELLLDAEALRYQHLYENKLAHKEREIKGDEILVLLDYAKAFSVRMMHFIESYELGSTNNNRYIIKPHVNAPINLQDFNLKDASITNENIESLLEKYDTAICSNMTSAQIDALIMNLKVIVLLEGEELNFSPLRGKQGVNFVYNSLDLEKIISNRRKVSNSNEHEDYFFYDKDLARWKKLIAM